MFGSRRTIVDFAAVAVFLVIVAVLFWPSDGGGGEDGDSAPDGVPEEELTPSPEPSPTAETDVATCETADSAGVLARFVTHFNDGNVDALGELLPDQGAESPSTAVFPGMERTALHSFRVHESGAMTNPGDVLGYLESAHDADHVWRLQDYSLVRLADYSGPDRPELDRAEVVIQRTAENLPTHELEGRAVIDCRGEQILFWEFSTDNIELALPISVDKFLDAVGPYGTAEMRDLRMLVSTELRPDGGSLAEWETRRIDANNSAGHYVQAVQVFTRDGSPVVDFVYDGSRWFMDQRGWHENGNITGEGVLPLEMMLTRNEPTATANLIRDHLDEIPDDGSYQISGEFDVDEDARRAMMRMHGTEDVHGVIEVDIHNQSIDRTRYRLVNQELDLSVTLVEIEWVHLERRTQFEPGLFIRPDGFRPNEQQYQPPAGIADRLAFQEEIDHRDGVGERYELAWAGETVSVTVSPSRGVSHQSTTGVDWPTNWRVEPTSVADLTVVQAGSPDAAVFPTAAVWDNGEFRFELSINPEALSDPSAWGAGQVNDIARALTDTDG